MLEFYHLTGGFLWWIIIRFCSTNLSDEQLETNKKRNQIFFYLIQILIIALVLYYFIYYQEYFKQKK
jgi:hypothetical protein